MARKLLVRQGQRLNLRGPGWNSLTGHKWSNLSGHRGLAKYLAETPVAADQAMTPIDGEWTRVQVKVHDTIQLRTWIRSLGPDAVVEEPGPLREQLKREWADLLFLYEGIN